MASVTLFTALEALAATCTTLSAIWDVPCAPSSDAVLTSVTECFTFLIVSQNALIIFVLSSLDKLSALPVPSGFAVLSSVSTAIGYVIFIPYFFINGNLYIVDF